MKTKKKILYIALYALAAAGASLTLTAAHAGKPPVNTEGGEFAIDGYDVVAYFHEGRPVRGSAEFSATYNGARWAFASAANRDRFRAAPGDFAPRYGGYCAYAVSQGYTAPIDPAAWKIVDRRLYLNYSKSVQRHWEADQARHIRDADRNWPAVLQ